jgi:hypothetical protein
MKAKFLLVAKACATGFKLTKEGENWHKDFVSIPQALLYARSAKDRESELVVMNSDGRKVAHMRV